MLYSLSRCTAVPIRTTPCVTISPTEVNIETDFELMHTQSNRHHAATAARMLLHPPLFRAVLLCRSAAVTRQLLSSTQSALPGCFALRACACVCVCVSPFSRNHFSPNEDTPCWVAWKNFLARLPSRLLAGAHS